MNDFKDLCRKVIDHQGESTLLLSFSRGKDSLGCFLRCLETDLFDKFVLFHFYPVKGLSFIDDYLEYFKKKYPFITLLDIPDPQLFKRRNSFLLQDPIRVAASVDFFKKFQPFPEYNNEQVEMFIKEDEGLKETVLSANGVKASDSPMRRLALSKTGPIGYNRKKWFSIYDWTNSDIADCLRRHDVKLPYDYELFGLTYDGGDYRFSKPLKDHLPKDFEKIKKEYPLIEMFMAKREHYYGTQIKKSRFNYKKLGLQVFSHRHE